jgi:hypothetical protein
MEDLQRHLKKHFLGEALIWRERLKDNTSPNIAGNDLPKTISEFEEFTEAYLTYFTEVANTRSLPFPWLEERIKSTLLEYWMPLSSIAVQYYFPEYQAKLREAHKKLDEFIGNAAELNIEIRDIVLYINKLPNSYFYPYTKRSFIALSWVDETIMNLDKPISDDMAMSLPHEIGHHVYWNHDFDKQQGDLFGSRPTLSETIWTQLSKETRMPSLESQEMTAVRSVITSWTEEIFADVLGTLISGRDGDTFANATQNQVKRFCDDPNDTIYNDGKHPIACLRPLISAQTILLKWPGSIKWIDFCRNLRAPEKTLDVEIPDADGNKITVPLRIMPVLRRALELAVADIYNNILCRKNDDGTFKGLKLSADHIMDFERLKDYANRKYSAEPEKINNFLLTPFIYQRGAFPGICYSCGWTTYVCSKCQG